MAASEVLELVARLRPEGADETTDALEDVQDTFEETADTAQQSADDLEGFSNRFEGAVGVAAGALAVAAGGLLSTVPIVGEAFAALGANVEAIGLQIDQFLRDIGAGGVTGFFFELADAIATADGPLGTIIGTIGTLFIAFSALTSAIATGLVLFGSASGPIAAVSGALSIVAGAVTTVGSALLSLPVILAAVVAAVVAFAAAYITNWNGVRDKTNEILSELPVRIPEAFRLGLELAANAVKQGGNVLLGIWEGVLNTTAQLVTDGINAIVSTIFDGVNRAINALNRLEGVNLNTAQFSGISAPGDVSFGRLETRSNQAIIRESRQRLQNRLAAERGQDTNQELIDVLRQLLASRENPPDIFLDGRKVSGGTSEYRGQNAAFRGR